MADDDNVIRPKFGQPRKPKLVVVPATVPSENELIDIANKIADKDDGGFRLDLDFNQESLRAMVRDVLGAHYGGTRAQQADCTRLGNILDSLQIQDNPAKIQVQRNQIRDYGNEQLFGLIGSASEQDIKLRPYFWRAMLEEAAGRPRVDE